MNYVLRSATLCLVACAPLVAQSAAKQRIRVPESDYNRWETLGNGALSPDGKWVAYDFRKGTATSELRYREVATETDHSVPRGSNPTFSANSRWLLYTINPDTGGAVGRGAGGGRGGRGGGGGGAASTAPSATANRNRFGLVDLSSGAVTTLEDVQSYALNKRGSHVALRRYNTSGGPATRGGDLVIRDLDQGTSISLGNVAEYAWSDDGNTLAMLIDVDGKTGNGIQVWTASGALKSLDAADALYSSLAWRKDSDDLAALRSRADSAFLDTSYSVVAVHGVGSRAAKQVYDFAADNTFPAGLRVTSYRAPQWSDDGSTIYVGIAPRDPKPMPVAKGAPMPARVEVWHWKDLREYHAQAVSGAQDRTRTQLAAWQLAPNKLVVLGHNPMETVQLSANRSIAVAVDEDPYFSEVISGRAYRDIYRIDPATGQRTKIATKTASAPQVSPDGKTVLFSQGGQWLSHDIATGATTSLTSKIKSVFVDMEDDHPVAERRAYGSAGWTTGEKSVIVYDRFDLWQIGVDGSSPVRLTRGREDSTVYRVVRLDPDVRTIDLSKPVMLSATGDYNKRSGYARLAPGGQAEKLIWLDKGVSRLTKAKDADVYSLVEQTYEESPNLFVATAALRDAKQVSNTNAFQSEYLWGKQVLIPYTNRRGDKLQMMLTYPANYEAGKKYPMVVYYYEKLSDGFHSYVVPTERSTYNTTVFSQEGYFVLRPDIVFTKRDPGYSGLDCVTAAVKAALATGMIDAQHVGNFGHSWGGYQSAFYAVHGKGTFAASIAGAPLTDLISMYGYTSGNTGAPETGHFETGQERMDVPLWKDPQAYIRNSTVFATDSLDVPLLIEAGDIDGNVNFWQSVELYNFGRRLGKNVVMLVYNQENHSVARPESQLDYHKRQIEWFAHYLKDEPAADWITNGESYLARQRILRDGGVVSPPPTASGIAPGGGRGSGPPRE
jgi:dipeptidyl aminopeptidase/acylaminoacyl peptidase